MARPGPAREDILGFAADLYCKTATSKGFFPGRTARYYTGSGYDEAVLNRIDAGRDKMNDRSIYTREIMAEHVSKYGFEIGEYTYGAPVIRWWGEDAKLTIGRFCSIAANVKIFLGGNHRSEWITSYPFPSSPMNQDWPNVNNRGLPVLPATNGDV